MDGAVEENERPWSFLCRLLQTSAGAVTVEGTWFGVSVTRYGDDGDRGAHVWAAPGGLAEALQKVGLPGTEARAIAAELETRLEALRPAPKSAWERRRSQARYYATLGAVVIPWGLGVAWLGSRLIRRRS